MAKKTAHKKTKSPKKPAEQKKVTINIQAVCPLSTSSIMLHATLEVIERSNLRALGARPLPVGVVGRNEGSKNGQYKDKQDQNHPHKGQRRRPDDVPGISDGISFRSGYVQTQFR